MNIEKLQIKRITSDWGIKQVYKPALGEFVLINVDNNFTIAILDGVNTIVNSKTTPFFVVGNGTDNVSTLIQNGKNIYLSHTAEMGFIGQLIATNSQDDAPAAVTSDNGAVGSSTKLARADHSHNLTKDTVVSLLSADTDISTLGYRKIMMGTEDPNDAGVTGSIGDIYIRYEE